MSYEGRITPPHLTLIAMAVMAAMSTAFIMGGDAILPTRVDEGPLVQKPGPGRTALVWYTSRPAKCVLTVEGLVDAQIKLSTSEGDTRHLAELSGLSNGKRYDYRIALENGQELFSSTIEMPPAPGEPIDFVVFGDSGKGTRVQFALAQQMIARNPDFLLHTGDLVYGDGARHKYPARFFAPYRELTDRIPFYPCLGNHDVNKEDGSALPYASVFELPQNGPADRPSDHEYWFDYGPARIVVLDSEVSEAVMANQVAPWVREVFDANAPEWRIVSFHRPPYAVGNYKGDLSVRRHLVPVFEEVGVDVVFNGHDHNYQRMNLIRDGQLAEDGILYLISGAGGARLYERKQKESQFVAVFNNDDHSATFVRIDGPTMLIEQFDTEGEVFDRWEFTPQTPATSQPVAY